jgi:thiamine transport system ATP-binding protein
MDAGGSAISGLICQDLTVAPGDAPVLRNLDLEVPDGTRTVLVGPSGAGKTTLLRAICGLERASGGSVRIGDRSVEGLPAHRRRCAMVFQEPRLLPNLDLVDNVAFALRGAGVRRSERRARARDLLGEVGLGGFGDRNVAGLSGGEQQRVALARALCPEPELLLLDEPLAAVDPNRRAALRQLIVELQRQREVTMLAVTHDRGEAAELGQRVALMLEGQIIQHDRPRELFERPAGAAVAGFFGANVVRGPVRSGQLLLGEAGIPVPGPDGEATVTIRPERVLLDPGSRLRMTVVEATYVGTYVRLALKGSGARLEAHCDVAVAPPAGAEVGVTLPQDRLWRIPDPGKAPVRR